MKVDGIKTFYYNRLSYKTFTALVQQYLNGILNLNTSNKKVQTKDVIKITQTIVCPNDVTVLDVMSIKSTSFEISTNSEALSLIRFPSVRPGLLKILIVDF
uniref:Uncharacterized protein n=1 Tax=Vespula pensylvanica TaxID=30213 RepID=A0A834K6N5_VESPE|nr:hypothetical protein H0235_016304 [Vespula pensylvanica]